MAVNVTVGRSARPREYLTEREIEKLIKAAGDNRWGHRDATAILIAYRHGLRASELVALRWDDIDFQTGKLHVRRAKGGPASVHPIGGRELRAPCDPHYHASLALQAQPAVPKKEASARPHLSAQQ